MKLFEIVALFCCCFTLAVLGVKLKKGCSIKEAIIICRDYVKEIFKALLAPTPPPKQYYPTIAGWDGSCIVLQFVDEDFIKIRENFSTCFCTNAAITDEGNIVMYRFEMQRKVNSLDDDVLFEIIQKQAEEVCVNTMRQYNFYLPTEPLTYIELYPHVLFVSFARTEDGIKILDNAKSKMKQRKLMKSVEKHSSMTENWEQK